MSRSLSIFYRSLGQTLGSGLPLAKALQLSKSRGGVSKHLAECLLRGETWDAALDTAPGWLPRHHRPVLAAAARSGRLPETLAHLSADAERQHKQTMQALGSCVYPIFLVHFAVVAVPLSTLVNGNPSEYVRTVLTGLLPLWAVIAALWLFAAKMPALAFVSGLWIPGVRGWLQSSQLSQTASIIEAQLNAGVSAPQAWESAAGALRWPALRMVALEAAAQGNAGGLPSDALAGKSCIPHEFNQLYISGEVSGKLDENLRHLTLQFDERAQRSLAAASFWYPKFLYIGVAIWVGAKIIGFYGGYYKQVNDLMGH